MFYMGFSRNGCLLISFSVYLLCFTPLVCSLDTIVPSLLIHEPETISSNNSMFTLGFFGPKNSTNRYVGIWFMTESNVVWIANRDKPLRDSFGILGISENGNLVVFDGQKQVVWSTNVSHITSNYSAQLLDSGNLILIDRNRGVSVWQSFQHPCNSLIQGMKISTNKKTGEKRQLTSWKSPSDPSYGQFSCSLETRNVTEVFVWKLNRPYFRTGPWDGIDFLGIPRISSSNSRDALKMEGGEGIFDLSFHADNTLWTFTLNSQGKVEQRSWNSQRNIWELNRIIGSSECDVYGKCGSFGICNSQNSPICSCLRGFEPRNREEWGRQNWTSGCVRTEALKCERDKNNSQAGKIDGFRVLEAVKLPDDAHVLPSYFADTVNCQTSCRKNCSCIAYAHERNLGCMIWISDLLDLQSFPDGGVDVYVRLTISELGTGSMKMTTPILISVLIGPIIVIVSGYFLLKKCSKQKGEMQMQTQDKRRIMRLKQVHIPELSLFDLKELATATNNFDITNKLGQGGFGPVYKGKVEDGKEIAVKKLSRSSGQGMEEFINEVELISKLQHRNLVRLFGCCIEEEILVYEYMPNKSLDTYIFDPQQEESFDWGKRSNIIEGITRGLLYLHRDSRLKIIHRDLKASNILLDKKMNPKISDFGMAKLFGGNEDKANTERIVGTYGYISPEYATEGLYSEKSDVFSFGVLLLEIISGRKNTSFYEDAESLTLLGFAWKLWIDGSVIPLIDPQIYDPRFHKDVLRCIHIGLLCVQELAKDRPTMASVMSMLQSEIMDVPPPGQPTFVLRQAMSCAAEQTVDNNELCSINLVTTSDCNGR